MHRYRGILLCLSGCICASGGTHQNHKTPPKKRWKQHYLVNPRRSQSPRIAHTTSSSEQTARPSASQHQVNPSSQKENRDAPHTLTSCHDDEDVMIAQTLATFSRSAIPNNRNHGAQERTSHEPLPSTECRHGYSKERSNLLSSNQIVQRLYTAITTNTCAEIRSIGYHIPSLDIVIYTDGHTARTPLTLGILSRNVLTLEALLTAGVNINFKAEEDEYPLIRAIKTGIPRVFQHILAYKPSWHIHGFTKPALHELVTSTLPVRDQHNVLRSIAYSHEADKVRYLRDEKHNNTFLHELIEHCNIRTLYSILSDQDLTPFICPLLYKKNTQGATPVDIGHKALPRNLSRKLTELDTSQRPHSS